MLTAVYLINRIPSVVLAEQSPYAVFHGHSPNLSHHRVLGCLCFATDTTKPDKFFPRAIAAVHMGYSTTQKAYRTLLFLILLQ